MNSKTITAKLGMVYSGFPVGGFYATINGEIVRNAPIGEMPKRYRTPEAAMLAAEKAFARMVRET